MSAPAARSSHFGGSRRSGVAMTGARRLYYAAPKKPTHIKHW